MKETPKSMMPEVAQNIGSMKMPLPTSSGQPQASNTMPKCGKK